MNPSNFNIYTSYLRKLYTSQSIKKYLFLAVPSGEFSDETEKYLYLRFVPRYCAVIDGYYRLLLKLESFFIPINKSTFIWVLL